MLIEDVFSLTPGTRIIARQRDSGLIIDQHGGFEYRVRVGDVAVIRHVGIDQGLNPYISFVLESDTDQREVRERPLAISKHFIFVGDEVADCDRFNATALCPICHLESAIYSQKEWTCSNGCDLNEYRYCKRCGTLFRGLSGKFCSTLCKDSAKSVQDA
ncbi:hypothetical protein [Gimesia aquarii]|uniref:Uncharacterized protein n=1 Tax=Gimesia aquarii TaxID=2527964 RepID=A0A517X1B5_9PLAN|nr:hypothetical protein [Gimesia aquarii]QDU11289.1 hypothetical protein V202x_47080 [Gimesia aquarii]